MIRSQGQVEAFAPVIQPQRPLGWLGARGSREVRYFNSPQKGNWKGNYLHHSEADNGSKFCDSEYATRQQLGQRSFRKQIQGNKYFFFFIGQIIVLSLNGAKRTHMKFQTCYYNSSTEYRTKHVGHNIQGIQQTCSRKEKVLIKLYEICFTYTTYLYFTHQKFGLGKN